MTLYDFCKVANECQNIAVTVNGRVISCDRDYIPEELIDCEILSVNIVDNGFVIDVQCERIKKAITDALRLFIDERDKIYTSLELMEEWKKYASEYENFGEYLNACMYYNNGTLTEIHYERR